MTGYWYRPEQDAAGHEMPAEPEKFLSEGEKPIFVAFGKAESKMPAELQRRTPEELVSGKYDARAGELSQVIKKEDGIGEAIRAIEAYVRQAHGAPDRSGQKARFAFGAAPQKHMTKAPAAVCGRGFNMPNILSIANPHAQINPIYAQIFHQKVVDSANRRNALDMI